MPDKSFIKGPYDAQSRSPTPDRRASRRNGAAYVLGVDARGHDPPNRVADRFGYAWLRFVVRLPGRLPWM